MFCGKPVTDTGSSNSGKKAGGGFLRGGALSLERLPYSFQGLGEEGIIFLKMQTGDRLPIVVELMSVEQIEMYEKDIDYYSNRCKEHAKL